MRANGTLFFPSFILVLLFPPLSTMAGATDASCTITIAGDALSSEKGQQPQLLLMPDGERFSGDTTLSLKPGEYELLTAESPYGSYGRFDVDQDCGLHGGHGVYFIEGRLEFELDALVPVEVDASSLHTEAKQQAYLKGVSWVSNEGLQSDRFYLPPADGYEVITMGAPHGVYGRFDVTEDGVAGEDGALVADTANALSIDLQRLTRVEIDSTSLISSAGALPHNYLSGVSFLSGAITAVYLPDGTFDLVTGYSNGHHSYGALSVLNGGVSVTGALVSAVEEESLTVRFDQASLARLTFHGKSLQSCDGQAMNLGIENIINLQSIEPVTAYLPEGTYNLVLGNGALLATLSVFREHGAFVVQSDSEIASVSDLDITLSTVMLQGIQLTPADGVWWSISGITATLDTTDTVFLPKTDYELMVFQDGVWTTHPLDLSSGALPEFDSDIISLTSMGQCYPDADTEEEDDDSSKKTGLEKAVESGKKNKKAISVIEDLLEKLKDRYAPRYYN